MREILFAAVGVLALALILSVSTCSRERDKHDATRDALAVSRSNVAACGAALNAVNAQAEATLEDAARMAQKGQEAAQAARADALRAAEREREAQRALQAAKREPDCADQLRMVLCPAIPLL